MGSILRYVYPFGLELGSRRLTVYRKLGDAIFRDV